VDASPAKIETLKTDLGKAADDAAGLASRRLPELKRTGTAQARSTGSR
jgi:hypothetical protein